MAAHHAPYWCVLEEFDVLTDAVLQLGIPTILIYPNVDAGSCSERPSDGPLQPS